MNLPDFLIIPSELITDTAIQPLDREVYGIIYWASKMKNEKCTMSNQTIATLLNANPFSISHAISRLAQRRYIFIKFTEDGSREEMLPLVHMKNNPWSNEQGGSANAQGGVAQMNNRIIIDNNKEKEINKEKDISSVFPLVGESISVSQDAKNSIVPLTELEKWQMATELNVPLWVVKEVEENFWNYIEDPKNRKKYKTSYKTIYRWVQMGLQKGNYKNNNEVEVMMLQSQHPDLIARSKAIKEMAKKEGLVE